eukprot:GHVU01232545.1.p1 GENE.GHVU01232545.1~~GHVU01232545.1.p1  ORF type:complete len:160 (+),score=40.53 GHVU01232545.1:367-846(+)
MFHIFDVSRRMTAEYGRSLASDAQLLFPREKEEHAEAEDEDFVDEEEEDEEEEDLDPGEARVEEEWRRAAEEDDDEYELRWGNAAHSDSPSLSTIQWKTVALEDFCVGALLGRGSYADVHKVVHIATGETYALKSVSPWQAGRHSTISYTCRCAGEGGS